MVFIPQYFRVIRAETVRIKAEAFVESAKVIGAGTGAHHVPARLRNATRTLPLIFTLNASEAILTLAGLGFLGFGIEPTVGRGVGLRPQQVAVGCHERHLVDLACSPASPSCSSCSASRWSARASTTWPTRGCAAARRWPAAEPGVVGVPGGVPGGAPDDRAGWACPELERGTGPSA